MNDRQNLETVILAGRRIHAAVDAIDYAISDHLGIHRNDLRVLNLLEEGALSPRIIAERIGLTSGSVTALIDRLEKAGFVERHPSTTDRRSIEVRITPQRYGEIGMLYKKCADGLMHRFGDQTGNKLKASADVLSDFAAAMEQVAESLTV